MTPSTADTTHTPQTGANDPDTADRNTTENDVQATANAAASGAPGTADVIIIGSGPGGYATALRAAELGRSVVLVERGDALGGTCLNRGCIPTKALITTARAVDAVRQAPNVGIDATITGIDFGTMVTYKNRIVRTMTEGLRGLLAHRGVVVLQGEATVTDPARRVVTIQANGGRDQVLCFRKAGVSESCGTTVNVQADDIVLATGSRPTPLPCHDFAGALIDSTQALSLVHVPATATIIGSGSIAVEFATIWSAGGCEVTMLIRHGRALSHWDRRSGTTLTRELKRRGIHIIPDTRITGVDVGVNLGATVHYTDAAGQERTIFSELALTAIGRVPNTDDAWCRALGVDMDDDGHIVTDAYGRTKASGIWAVGDITRGPGLASRAFAQGITIAERMAGHDCTPVDDDAVAQVVFSSPEAATVGCTMEQARDREDLDHVRESMYPMLSNARMLMSGSAGSMSIVSGERREQPGVEVVLGVHIVAPNASDMIGEAEQIIANRIPLDRASSITHPHPTFSEAFGEALLLADGRPLHTR